MYKTLYDTFIPVNNLFEEKMKIREYMEANKLTHREFAKKMDISSSTICHFLNGRTKSISLPVIQKIVKGSDGVISFDDLIEEVGNGRGRE